MTHTLFTKNRFIVKLALPLALAALAFGPSARAASSSWSVDTNGNWVNGSSWTGNVVPGATSGNASTDIATFGNTLTANRSVTVDTNRNIGGITFSNTSAFKFTLTGGNLLLSNGGVIQTAAGNGNHTDTISTAIAIQGNGGAATFTAGATSAASLLSIGAVTGVSTTGNTTTLTLNGTNTGANAVTGVIGNGAGGGKLAVVKSDAGTWTLSGANTFTGGVTLNAGTLNINSAAALGAAASSIFTINGGTLAYTGGSSAGLTTGNYAQGWNGNFGFTTDRYLSPALFAATGTTNSPGYNDQALNLGTGAVSLGTAAGTTRTITSDGYYSNLTVGGIISNGTTANSLTKDGTGILTLTGANAFTGGITLNAGALQINAGAALGTGALTINGGSLVTTAATTFTNNNAQTWNGAFSVRTTGTNNTSLNMGTGAITLGGNITVTDAATAAFTLGGAIGDGGSNYGVTWVSGYNYGFPVITLTGASTYGGPTVVQSQTSATLANGGGSVAMTTGTLANTSAVTVNGGGKFLVGTTGAGVTNRINPNASLILGGNGGGIFQLTGSQNATVNKQTFASLTVGAGTDVLFTDQSISNVSQITFSGASGANYNRNVGGVLNVNSLVGNSGITFTNAVTGAGNISGSGANAILIGGYSDGNYFAGLSSGTSGTVVQAASTANWGSGLNTDVAVASSTAIGGVSQSLRFTGTISSSLTLPGAFTVESGGILAHWQTNLPVITGGTLKTGLSGGDLWIAGNPVNLDGAHGLVINSQIIDNATSSLTFGGGRALYLTNTNNTYAGGTYLGGTGVGGILNVASAGSLGSGAINFTGPDTLQAAGNVTLGTRAVNIGTGVTATFDTNGNAITVGGVISGVNSGLTKTGMGTLTLSGANTYTGITSVTNGTLKLDFSASGAPTSNIINPNSLLAVGSFVNAIGTATIAAQSDTLLIQGAANTANSQTFGTTPSPLGAMGSTTLGYGMTNMVFNAGAGGSLDVNLGNLITYRGYMDVTTSGNVTVSGVNVNNVITGGIMSYVGASFQGGTTLETWVTVNKSTWGTVTAAGNLVGLADNTYTQNTGGSIATSKMADIVANGALPSGGLSAQTLRFNDTLNSGVGKTVTLDTTAASQLIYGAILVTPNVGAHDSTISGGFLTPVNNSRGMAVFQNNTSGNLVISSQITDSWGTGMFAKNGAGTLVLNGVNSITGSFFVNEGTVIATGDFKQSSVQSITTTAGAAGSITVGVTDSSKLFVGQVLNVSSLVVPNGGRSNIVTAIIDATHVTVATSATPTSTTVSGTFQMGGALGGFASTTTTAYIANGATLQIGSAATGNQGGLSSDMQVSNLGALILNHSGNNTFANTITGAVALNSISGTGNINTLEIAGGGNTTLGGNGTVNGSGAAAGSVYTLTTAGNVYVGQAVSGTNIQAGTVVNSIGLDGVTVNLSKTISAGGATNVTFSTVNTFAGNTRITGNSTLTLGSNLALQLGTLNYNTSDSGTLSFGSLTTPTLGGLGGDKALALTNASSAAVALTVGGNNMDAAYSGNLTGSGGSLTKTGIGTLTLTGTNSYAGGTTVSQGTLKGSATGLQGNISAATGAFVAFDQSTAGTYAGALSGAGNVIKTGVGALTLNGTNTNTGLTTISAGTLQFAKTASLYNSTTGSWTAANISVASGATLALNVGGTGEFSTGNVTTILTNLGGLGAAVSYNGLQAGSKIAFDTTNASGGNFTVANNIADSTGTNGGGSIGVTKLGTNTLTLNATNSYTGKTIVQKGTLSFTVGNTTATAAQSLGANSTLDLGVAATSSGILNYSGSGAATLAKNINALGNGSDTIQNSTSSLLTLTGTLTKNGTVLTLKGGTGGITVSGAGTIAGSSSGSDLIVDGGTTTLATANSYNGPTFIINGATLNATATGALPTANGRTAVSIDQSGNGTSTLALGASQSVASLAGAATSKVTLGANTLTVGTTGNSTTFAGVISGTNGNVIKDGTSTQVFSGNNTYTGTTTVTAGTLQAGATNALGSTSGITLATGGTLLVSADKAIGSNTTITMNSTATGNGTAAALKFSSSYNGTVGALALDYNSIFDLGTDATGVKIHFSSIFLNGYTLSIYNWTGTTLWEGGTGNNTDQIYAGNRLSDSDLADISFYSGLDASSFRGNGYQIMSGSFQDELGPVPEPSTWVAMAALIITGGTLGMRRRASLNK